MNFHIGESLKHVFSELGMSEGTIMIVLIALYFIIKWAVKNGVKEAYDDIMDKKAAENEDTDEE